MSRSLVLDFDDSVHGIDADRPAGFADWQEAIRFGCGRATWNRFRRFLQERLPAEYGTVLMGSGDFHHVSHLLLERLPSGRPVDVVVFDNHPDNMRFPFGIHCGSWVMHAARLPTVRRIHVLGITSPDVGWGHAWENHLRPLFTGKVRYWTIGVDSRWSSFLGLSSAIRSFGTAGELVGAFVAGVASEITGGVYLSIDKDALAPEVARTNWDQGCLGLGDVRRIIGALSGRIVGSDITGEISVYRYQTAWKRWLSAADDQPATAPVDLPGWQAQQMAVNRQLLQWIGEAQA